MSRRIAIVTLLLLGAAGLPFLAQTGRAAAETLREVFVVNFPEVQRVEGAVTVEGALRMSETGAFENILVPPVGRRDTTRYVDAGRLVTGGFPTVVLSLHGQVKGAVTRRGVVGAILVPDREPIQQAFNEQGLTHFALEVASNEIAPETSFFASAQPRVPVGFERYRVLLYNTTDKAVTVNLFTYLTH